jgi:tRNA threonylcarbamoyladenosine biosynthesis protein TsaE
MVFKDLGEHELDNLAIELLPLINKHKVVVFEGEMGAGKTTFIKSICQKLGYTGLVNSPTYALANAYETENQKKIWHFDFYRIKSEEEAYDIGFEEYLYGGDICLIEWPSKVETLLPVNKLEIKILINQNNTRTINTKVYEPKR